MQSAAGSTSSRASPLGRLLVLPAACEQLLRICYLFADAYQAQALACYVACALPQAHGRLLPLLCDCWPTACASQVPASCRCCCCAVAAEVSLLLMPACCRMLAARGCRCLREAVMLRAGSVYCCTAGGRRHAAHSGQSCSTLHPSRHLACKNCAPAADCTLLHCMLMQVDAGNVLDRYTCVFMGQLLGNSTGPVTK